MRRKPVCGSALYSYSEQLIAIGGHQIGKMLDIGSAFQFIESVMVKILRSQKHRPVYKVAQSDRFVEEHRMVLNMFCNEESLLLRRQVHQTIS